MAEHLHVWGVKNTPELEKLLEIFEEYQVPHTFYDYRDNPPEDHQLKKWAEYMEEEYPVNLRSTLWKKSEKVFGRLDDEGKMNWLRKHYHVLERPIIEDENGEILSVGGRPERIAKNLCNITV